MSEVKIRVGAEGVDRVHAQFGKLARGLGGMGDEASRSASKVDRAVRFLDSRLSGLAGQLTGVLGGLGAGMVARDLVQTEAQMARLGITFGKSSGDVSQLRGQLRGLAMELGVSTSSLQDAFESMVAGGMEWDQARGAIGAVADAMAQTGAEGRVLADALGVAKENFGFDLTGPGVAIRLLDQMAKGAAVGKLELTKMADGLSRFGGTAASVRAGFSETLAVAELLSRTEAPERLATSVDAFFRAFADSGNLKALDRMPGITVFDAQGNKRAFGEIFGDLKRQFDRLGSDKKRMAFLSQAFKSMDIEARKALNYLLSGSNYEELQRGIAIIEKGEALTAENRKRALETTLAQLTQIKEQWQDITETQISPLLKKLASISKYLAEHKALTQGLMRGGLVVAGGLMGVKALASGASLLQGLMPTAGGAGGGGAPGGLLGGLAGIGVQRVWVVNLPGGGLGGGAGGFGGGQGAWQEFLGPGGSVPATTTAMTGLQKATVAAGYGLAALQAFAIGWTIGSAIDEAFGLSDKLAGVGGRRSGDASDRAEIEESLAAQTERLRAAVAAGTLTQGRAESNLRAVARSQGTSMGMAAEQADAFAARAAEALRQSIVEGKVTVRVWVDGNGLVRATPTAEIQSGSITLEEEYLRGSYDITM
jgi:hypothetical protein